MSELRRWAVPTALLFHPVHSLAHDTSDKASAHTAPARSAPAQGSAPDRFTATISGRFVDSEGAAIAGVEVIHSYWPGDSVRCSSDAEGRFSTAISWSSALDSTWYALEARRFGYARIEYSALERLRPGQALDVGTLILHPGGALAGSALGSNGQPLPGTRIAAVMANDESRRFTREDGPPFASQVDACLVQDTGRFDLVGLPPGRWVLWAKHDTTYWSSSDVLELPAGRRVEAAALALYPLPLDQCVEGTVSDSAGTPIAGAVVSCNLPSKELSTSHRGITIRHETTTDAAGRFRLFLPHGYQWPFDLRAEVLDERFAPAELADVRHGDRDLHIQLGELRTVQLEVVDTSGNPVEHYGWHLIRSDSFSMEAGAQGSAHRPAGRATARVPSGRTRLVIQSDRHKQQVEFVPEGQVTEPLRFVLEPLPCVTGTVLSGNEPVPNALVELVQRDPNFIGKEVLPDHWSGLHYGNSDPIRADERGRFALPSDFPHLKYYVHAWAPGHAEGFSERAFVGGDAVVVELPPASGLDGVVLLPIGADPEGIEIEVYRKQVHSIESTLGLVFRTAVDASGRWRFDSLAAGPWLARVRVPGTLASELGWDRERLERTLEIPWLLHAPPAATASAAIDLREESFCRLEGRLKVGGFIREGYGNLLLEPPLGLRTAFSGVQADGTFSLWTRQPGRYRLHLEAGPGHGQYKPITDIVELQPGTTEWVRDLAPELWNGPGIRLDVP